MNGRCCAYEVRHLFHPGGLLQGHHLWFGQGCPDEWYDNRVASARKDKSLSAIRQ